MRPPERPGAARISQRLGIWVSVWRPLQLETGLAAAGGSGTGSGEGSRGLAGNGQVQRRAGDRWHQQQRDQCLLPGAGSLPGAGEALATGGLGCQQETSDQLERSEEAGKAPCTGPEGDQAAASVDQSHHYPTQCCNRLSSTRSLDMATRMPSSLAAAEIAWINPPDPVPQPATLNKLI